jgi:hypothetical protein
MFHLLLLKKLLLALVEEGEEVTERECPKTVTLGNLAVSVVSIAVLLGVVNDLAIEIMVLVTETIVEMTGGINTAFVEDGGIMTAMIMAVIGVEIIGIITVHVIVVWEDAMITTRLVIIINESQNGCMKMLA